MRCVLISILVATLSFLGGKFANAEVDSQPMENILGLWATQGYGAVVRLEACESNSAELCGVLVWAWEPDALKEGALGSLLFADATYTDNAWRKAKLWNPEDGRTYRGTIVQVSPDRLRLKGCAAGIFCREQTWLRLETLPHIDAQTRIAQ